ncbi:MBL fold metallo-hydrolase [Aeoliella sp. ICT_H6.2]|uniref:MBL fold metallo-hydrolase n=1 Tax=Aeoliella straminimaris TaxID=2954799 RepID=A0A9X2JI68_9BACT|nr:MBL fold metallo-hydrolase [Aeoliella straminimaris]MCO6043634.1 MBL fold metallo-hydrolase [Aeoliella straminimaris]
MFHYDNGLKITRAGLGVDVRRRQQRGFVSHAHADHMARHEWAYATPATAALYRHRLGPKLAVREMPYRTPLEMGGVQLTTYPAGHCLGSAMLLADDGRERLLYTGDFKLGESLTAEAAELPTADVLVMETTFGSPRYRMPSREVVIEQLLETIQTAFSKDQTPVVHAYALGKAQEVTAILTRAGLAVLQHPDIAAISRVYQQQGANLGNYAAYGGRLPAGHVVVTLPRSMRGFRLAGLGQVFSIGVTGWAIDPSTQYRQRVDVALPLSDHADFDELLEAARRVSPRRIYTTHGPPGFDQHLRAAGFDAVPLVPDRQRRLFA